MKSLSFIRSATNGRDSDLPPKLKPFKGLAEKMSSACKGLLSIAVFAAIVGITPKAMALQIGDAGPGVAELQQALGIPTDGLFGCQTQAAVASFQISRGLLVDGVAGPQTLSALGLCGNCYYSAGYYPSDNYDNYDNRDNGAPISTSYYTQPPVFLNPGPQPPNNGFIVVVPGHDPGRLAEIQRIYPFAAIDGTDWGSFINVGTFPERATAIHVANRLKGFGYAARVTNRAVLQGQSQ
jgi:hypothetical protein